MQKVLAFQTSQQLGLRVITFTVSSLSVLKMIGVSRSS